VDRGARDGARIRRYGAGASGDRGVHDAEGDREIIAPLFVLGWGWLTRDTPAGGVVCLMVISVPLGAFLGYLNGTCAAGIFLVMDKFEKYMQGERPVIDVSTAPPAGAS
jgi:hypothetical protein